MASRRTFVSVSAAAEALGVSASTIWRMLRSGALPSIRRAGRRLIPEDALARRPAPATAADIPPFTRGHPIFRLVGAGRGGGAPPGARRKHRILDR